MRRYRYRAAGKGNQSVVGQNVIFQSPADLSSSKLTTLYQKQQDDFNKAYEVNQRIVRLDPKDANAQLNLGQAAQSAGNADAAIAAYRKFIKLAPDDPTTALVRQQIKAIQQAGTSPTVSGG